jgi:Ni/Co efflux regulator RcnB
MKYMITAAAALSLLAAGGALAQEEHHRGDRGGGGDRGDRGGQQQQPQVQPQGVNPGNVPHNRAGQEVFRGGDNRGGDRGDRGDNRGPGSGFDRGRPESRGDERRGDFRGRDDDRRFEGGRPDFRPEFRRGPEPGFRAGGFLRERGWRGGSRFHAAPFRYPRGFAYRYWAFGSYLPPVFLAPDYTIGDYWAYGLPAPPPGFHWIRNGPDALLVRYYDGYVLDAAYGIFY